MDVAFPHLGIYIKHLVNHIDVFGFRIAFYGIIIGLGMLAGINIACADAKKKRTKSRSLSGLCHVCNSAFDNRCENLLCSI